MYKKRSETNTSFKNNNTLNVRTHKLEVTSSGPGSWVTGPALAVSLGLNLAAATHYLVASQVR